MSKITQIDAAPPYTSKEIFSSYSLWPKKRLGWRFVANSALVSAGALFLHCGVPLIS